MFVSNTGIIFSDKRLEMEFFYGLGLVLVVSVLVKNVMWSKSCTEYCGFCEIFEVTKRPLLSNAKHYHL